MKCESFPVLCSVFFPLTSDLLSFLSTLYMDLAVFNLPRGRYFLIKKVYMEY